MSAVTADWLALREGFDAAARAAGLAGRLAAAAAPRRILDLGAGTGANFRYLAPRLECDQHWTLVDLAPALLAAVAPAVGSWAAQRGWPVERHGADLAVAAGERRWTASCRRLDLARRLDALDWASLDVVTASALMDLVSARWFDDLAGRCRAAGCALLIALTYDGRRVWTPPDPDDGRIVAWFNRHQRQDAGLGPAMGASAGGHMERALTGLGYRVWTARSDWRVGGAQAAMHLALVEDAARACRELIPAEGARIDVWAGRRRRLAGRSRLVVGHVDLLALP